MGEGTGKVMQNELGTIVDLVTSMLTDPRPRVPYTACQCVGQLWYGLYVRLLASEIPPCARRNHTRTIPCLCNLPTCLEHPELSVHSHGAVTLINFCEGAKRDTLLPYPSSITGVGQLLKLLDPFRDPTLARRYVQKQAITTLAMVTDAREVTFAEASWMHG